VGLEIDIEELKYAQDQFVKLVSKAMIKATLTLLSFRNNMPYEHK